MLQKPPTKKDLLDHLHTVVSNNVLGDKQLMNRYKGFRSELFFEEKIKNIDVELFEGGNIISKSSEDTSLNDAIYFTLIPISIPIDSYQKIYHELSKIGFDTMYIIQYHDNWSLKNVMIFEAGVISLPVPEFTIYQYQNNSFTKKENINVLTNEFKSLPNRGKNSYSISKDSYKWLHRELDQFSIDSILQIYVTRLLFDGYIGFGKEKGKPSDIDFILKNKNGEYRLLEIKEKDLPKKSKKGFGLDVPRIHDFQHIQKITGLKYYLVVREIKDQDSREFKAWKTITIDNFIEDVKKDSTVEGGTGMRSSNSRNPTLICSYSKFQDF